jgi:hypothetical protein
MIFAFRNLHAQTRQHMVNEINAARDRSTLYHSTRFNDQGRAAWHGLLVEAAGTYDEHWLAYHLDEMGCFKGFEYRAKPNAVTPRRMFRKPRRKPWPTPSSTGTT